MAIQESQYLRTVPRQARSAARLRSIYDAAGELLADGGYEALSITAVAAKVGIPAASVYDYVADARALLAAFVTQRFADIADSMSDILVAGDTAEGSLANVRAVFGLYFDLLRNDRGFRIAIAATHADDDLAQISFDDSLRNAAQLKAMVDPFIRPGREQEVTDRCLLAVHLSGAVARLLLMIDDADAQRLIETYIDVFTANIIES